MAGQAHSRFAVLLLLAAQGCAQPSRDPARLEHWYPSANEQGDALAAVFEGRIPCSRPELAGCDKVKVSLALYGKGHPDPPTTYKLALVYVAADPEGSRLVVSGSASVVRGTGLDPLATVYRLDARAPSELQAYWLIGKDILFVLDERLNPRVGTAGWSYVLNRTR